MQMHEIEAREDRSAMKDRDDLFDLLRATRDGVFAVDSGQRIAFWNSATPPILGLESEAVIGRPCHEVLAGRDERGCAVCKPGCATFRASKCGRLSPTTNVEVLARDGRRKWINVSTFLLPSRWRELALLIHVFRDVHEGSLDHHVASMLSAVNRGVEREELPRPPDGLTPREIQTLRLLAQGASTSMICARLDIESTTVRTHVQHLLDKLGVHSRLEAVAFASRNGFFSVADD